MKAFALALMVGLFSCASVLAQPCAVPLVETIDHPGTYGTKVWRQVQFQDGRVITVPVIDGNLPTINERYYNGVFYRTYSYPQGPAPVKKEVAPVTKPAPTAEDLKKAIEAFNKEYAEFKKEVELHKKETPLKKEEGVSPIPLPKEVKGPPADGPTTPFRRPAPSSKKTTDDK